MRRASALGWLAIVGGLALAAAAQVREPVPVPLYDGVPVVEPYRFLAPGPGQVGDPTSFSSAPAVSGDQSPVLVAATTESPPQAQLVALADAFALTEGATGLRVSITPVETDATPSKGTIVGNVYRFEVTDQDGKPLAGKRCEGCRTLVLRAPEGTTDAEVHLLLGGSWTGLQTSHAAGLYRASPDALGDFALVTSSAGPGGGRFDPLIIAVLALAVLLVAVAGLFWYRRRTPTMPVAELRPTRRLPSKRRGSGKTPRGRSDS